MEKKIKKTGKKKNESVQKNKKMQSPIPHKENPKDGNIGKNNAGGYE